MPKLTKTVVDGAEPRAKQFTIWCSDLKGFGVYVHPSGRRSYFVDYRVGPARRRMTIGEHGSVTTEQARKLAIETLGGIVLKKEDPLQERRTRRKSQTVAQLCDQYMGAVAKGLILGRRKKKPKKTSTVEVDRGRISRHIKPLLGSRLVVDLARADIAKFVRDVTAGKTAFKDRSGKNGNRVHVTGGAGTAVRTAGLLGGILAYAVDEGIITINPARGVKLPSDNVRNRRLSPDEYRQLGAALTGPESDADARQATTGAWLLALTGCRLGEVEQLKWIEVDELGGCFRLEDSKSGPSVRPVGRPAFLALEDALRVKGSPFVLPGLRSSGTHYKGLAGAWGRFMARAGLERVTPHTMRHSFASVAGDLGYADSTIAAMLGHAGGTVTSKYVHRLDTVLVAAANKVCAEVYRQMTGEAGNVVEMPRGGLRTGRLCRAANLQGASGA